MEAISLWLDGVKLKQSQGNSPLANQWDEILVALHVNQSPLHANKEETRYNWFAYIEANFLLMHILPS